MSKPGRKERAIADLKRAHRSFAVILGESQRAEGRPDEERLKTAEALLKACADLFERSRLAARPQASRTRTQSFLQKTGFRVLALTENLPQSQRIKPHEAPSELLLDPESLRRSALDLFGAWIDWIEQGEISLLKTSFVQHPLYGDLDLFEVVRSVAILARAAEFPTS